MKIVRACLSHKPQTQVRPVESTAGGRSARRCRSHDRLPLIFEVLRQVRVHGRRFQWHLPGRISGEASFDAHCSCTIDETSFSTHGALEPLQRRPVLIQAIQQLGMQRIGRTNALLIVVVRRRRIARKQCGVVAVQVRETARHSRDSREAFGVRSLEQPAPDDLERLVLARRPPLVPRRGGSRSGGVQRELAFAPPISMSLPRPSCRCRMRGSRPSITPGTSAQSQSGTGRR